MFQRKSSRLESYLQTLETHLQQEREQESPILLALVRNFGELDEVAHGLGLFAQEEATFVRDIRWWPVISVLGTYSAGKSTFINDYLGYPLQRTGNQAVDDKFTVICFSREDADRTLPALALDADPRFPFYRISRALREGVAGEEHQLDRYLQLKTCPSEVVRGRIFIDSPGFDADEQRTAVLRMTDQILDVSDLVLVFFDARHPESGTMRDTLDHLVAQTVHRPDANKFLYILNIVDATAREDNIEDVVASWERALAQKGLTAGRFYRIFSRSAALPIEDPTVRARYETKRETDVADIDTRIKQVRTGQTYRLVGDLGQTARQLQEQLVPQLQARLRNWRNRVLGLDILVWGIAGVLGGFATWSGRWDVPDMVLSLSAPYPWSWSVGGGILLSLMICIHFVVRKSIARRLLASFCRKTEDVDYRDRFVRAFNKNTRWDRSIFSTTPVGWNRHARRVLQKVLDDAGRYVQELNDIYAAPSGRS